MAFNGSGQFVRVHDWTTDLTNTVPVTASRMDAEDDGFATGLSTTICRDGQSTTTARIPFAAGVGVSDGSEATPGINFISDTNSGIWRIGADNIGVGVNGAKVLDIATTGLTVTGTFAHSGNLAINTDKFTVAGATGNTAVGGTLAVTGAATLSSTAEVTGNFTVNTDKFTVAAASGNTAVGGTLAVTGAATLASVAGNAVATQADQETGTSTTTVVSPGRQHFHPSAAKAWGKITWSGGTPTLAANYNVSGITDNGTGQVTITFSTALSSANYAALVTPLQSDEARRIVLVTAQSTTTFSVSIVLADGGGTVDPGGIYFVVFGDI